MGRKAEAEGRQGVTEEDALKILVEKSEAEKRLEEGRKGEKVWKSENESEEGRQRRKTTGEQKGGRQGSVRGEL